MHLASLQKRTDEELMHVLQAGSQDALAVLFERYYRLVFHTAVGIVRDRSEAEDVMQDVFLEIYRDAAKFDPLRGKLRTWLLQYAYHRSLNRRKYLATRGFYERPETRDRAPVPLPAMHQRNGLNSHDWATTIHKGLRQLKPKERQAIELVCYQGLLLREIAENLRDSLPNVRNHYYRGLRKLRGFLEVTPLPPRTSCGREVAPAA
jgi:RNA polymerase sigma-70 factor (ECF subfamily)